MRLLFSFGLCILLSSWAYSQPEFTDITEAAGIAAFEGSEGVSVGDFNNDGFEDFFVTVPFGENRLFKNMGDGTFLDVAASAGVALSENIQSRSAVWGDINNDGWLDLYVGNRNYQDYLFLNLGDETFEEISLSAGIFLTGNPVSVNMADLNNDGWLDIYVSNFMAHNATYLNNKNNTFTFFTFTSQALDTGLAMGTVLFDYDKDGDTDIYLVHDGFEPNFLYQNDGTGVFTEVSEEAGVNTASFGMGVDIGDINNDGWMDIHIANLGKNILLLNNGNESYTDISESANIEDVGMGWGTTFLDYDNDGLQDIYVANDYAFSPHPNLLYRNSGNLTFEKAEEGGPVTNEQNSYGVATIDCNMDGNLDLLVANKNPGYGIQVFENADRLNNWLGINLIGTMSNRNGIGAKLTMVDSLGTIHYRELVAGQSWSSQNSRFLNFGMGEVTGIQEFNIHWPSGLVQEVTIPELNSYYTIIEGGAIEAGIVYPVPITTTVSTIPPSCNGVADGSVLLQPSGGTPDYTYNWDHPQASGNNPTNLSAGTYCVTITDANGMTFSTCVELPAANEVIISTLTVIDVSCHGNQDGMAAVYAYGGNAPYTYTWSNEATTPNIEELGPGTYIVTATDANGCTSTGTSVTITQPDSLIMDLNSTPEINNNADGTASASLNGGTPDYSYEWSTIPVQTTSTAVGLTQGFYALTVTDARGCEITDSVLVDQTQVVTLAAPDGICLDAGIQTELSGGEPHGGIYSGEGVTDDGNGQTYTFDPASAGLGPHIIHYTFGNEMATGEIEVFPSPVVSLTFPDTIFYDGEMLPSNIGGGLPEGGIYSDLNNQVFDDGNGMTFGFDTLALGENTLFYTFTDENGCSGIAEHIFNVVLLTKQDNPLWADIEIFPNPTSGQIELSGIPVDKIQVLNPYGKIIRKYLHPESSIDLTLLPNGVYFLKITSGKYIFFKQFIKQ